MLLSRSTIAISLLLGILTLTAPSARGCKVASLLYAPGMELASVIHDPEYLHSSILRYDRDSVSGAQLFLSVRPDGEVRFVVVTAKTQDVSIYPVLALTHNVDIDIKTNIDISLARNISYMFHKLGSLPENLLPVATGPRSFTASTVASPGVMFDRDFVEIAKIFEGLLTSVSSKEAVNWENVIREIGQELSNFPPCYFSSKMNPPS